LVERLMGRNAEPRFRFIQENAKFVRDMDLDV
jgi:topoisomerase-4 subunit B